MERSAGQGADGASYGQWSYARSSPDGGRLQKSYDACEDLVYEVGTINDFRQKNLPGSYLGWRHAIPRHDVHFDLGFSHRLSSSRKSVKILSGTPA